MALHICLLFLSLIISSHGNPTIRSVCPPEDSISPCQCTPENEGIELRCIGQSVTQQSIQDAFDSARAVNNIPLSSPDPINWLNVTSFIMTLTRLNRLDVSTLFNTVNFKGIQISWNPFLEGFDLDSMVTPGQFATEHVQLEGPAMTAAGILNFLSILPPQPVKHLLLSPRGPSSSVRSDVVNNFIENLGVFTNLVSLNLQFPLFPRIAGGQFRGFRKLRSLTLVSRNIEELGEGALMMDIPLEEMKDVELSFWLGSNNLTDEKIHPNLGLEAIGRPIQLGLEYNRLETLSERKFKRFLFENVRSKMRVKGNKVLCDERLKWMKEAKELLEKRVSGVNCANDRGKTIFTTSMV